MKTLNFPKHLGTVYAPWAPSTQRIVNRLPVARGWCLDLGTGSGILALHMAQTSECVFATDVDMKALRYARLAAVNNRIKGVHWLHGFDYEPVVGRTFDLIVGQPPFEPTANSRGFTFADGGAAGTETLERWMHGAPEHLKPRGRALFLGVLSDPDVWIEQGWEVERLATAPHGLYGAFRFTNT